MSDRLLPILTTPGVIGIVGAGKTPVPIDDEEIEAVRAILRSGLAVQPWPLLRVGSKVYIEGGPLAGLEGIVTNTDKVYRLVVSVSLLQRSVAVEIDREWARPIADGMGPPRCDPVRTYPSLGTCWLRANQALRSRVARKLGNWPASP